MNELLIGALVTDSWWEPSPIAAPMIGGMVTATVLTLLVFPVIYFIWRRRQLKLPSK